MARPAFKTVSEEMRGLCFILGEELLRWPDVISRPMFGMRAFYRGDTVFAMLPDKRSLRNANAIMYKLASGKEKREGEKWKFFELTDASEISGALAALEKAYRKAMRKTASSQPR